MTSLYTLSNELLNIIHGDDNGEIDTTKLDELQPKLEDKVQNIGLLLQDWEGNIEKIKNEIDRLKKMKEAIENKQERLKDYVKDNLIKLGIEKVETPLIKASLTKSQETIITDVLKLPKILQIVEIKAKSKTEIKAYIKSKGPIKGAELKENININFK